MDSKALQQRLPLLWFDRLLRRLGPLLPLPVVALRLASDLFVLRREQHQLTGLQSGRLQGHYTETAVVYLGVSAVRLVVYFLHCAGMPPLMLMPPQWKLQLQGLYFAWPQGRLLLQMTPTPQQYNQRLKDFPGTCATAACVAADPARSVCM